MLCIKATILLYEDRRKTPFATGYHPVFDFLPETPQLKAGGKINLLDREELAPGEKAQAEVWFPFIDSPADKLAIEYLGSDFGIGKRFTFGEGGKPMGEGIVDEINDCQPPFPSRPE